MPPPSNGDVDVPGGKVKLGRLQALVDKLVAESIDAKKKGLALASELRDFKEGGVVGKIKAIALLKKDGQALVDNVKGIRDDAKEIKEAYSADPRGALWGLIGILTGLLHRRFAN